MKKHRTRAQISADKLRTGRPRKAEAQKRNRQVTVYLTEAEWTQLRKLAKEGNVSVASLIMRPWREQKG